MAMITIQRTAAIQDGRRFLRGADGSTGSNGIAFATPHSHGICAQPRSSNSALSRFGSSTFRPQFGQLNGSANGAECTSDIAIYDTLMSG